MHEDERLDVFQILYLLFQRITFGVKLEDCDLAMKSNTITRSRKPYSIDTG
ncbi:hypothetical protein D3C86_2006840 [compost metagenome]